MSEAAVLLSFATATRNDALEFASRTLLNLDFIKRGQQHKKNVHGVTHLANSLLGLVVFPLERHFVKYLLNQQLADLINEGWPTWNIELGNSQTLGELVYHIRNAAAHGRLHFSSDSDSPSMVTITIEDAKNKDAPIYWRASIRADMLEVFLRLYVKKLNDVIG